MTVRIERRAILKAERAATYADHAAAHAHDEAGGRFAKVNPGTVIGSEPIASYPRLPASSPWASDPVPAEEPLGIDVNAVEPLGTVAEIEQSLREMRDDVGDSPPAAEVALEMS